MRIRRADGAGRPVLLKAPFETEIDPGDYVVEIAKDGFEPVHMPVRLASNAEHRVFVPRLRSEKATGTVKLSDGKKIEVFFSATTPVALMRVPKGTTFELLRPTSISQLGYPDAVFDRSENQISYTQESTEAFNYAVAVLVCCGDTFKAILKIIVIGYFLDIIGIRISFVFDGGYLFGQ